MTQIADSPKRPKVDLMGTYRLEEPTQKVNPKDGQTYEVPRGEYPVMGLLSSDGKKVENVGVIFTAANATTGELISVVERLRPIDVPALVQRQQIRMEAKTDKSLRYPLSMFLGEAPSPTKNQSQSRNQSQTQTQEKGHEQTQGHRMSVGG
jgi:hypothetical protein